MKQHWRRYLPIMGLAACLTVVQSACVVRARARVKPAYVVDVEPPPPKRVTVRERSGYIWIRGHWERRGSRWLWVEGRYERERTGYRWEPGRWEKRGNRYHWIQGRWVAGARGRAVVRDHREPAPPPRREPVVRDHRDQPAPPPRPDVRDHRERVPAYPTEAPPAPRYKANPGKRSGHVWVRGHWEWRAGKWAWVEGHWEAARLGYRWQEGSWERRGDRYVWVEGRWVKSAKVRDHRKR